MVKILSFIGIFLFTASFGQTFQNVRKRIDEDKIIIIYDLISVDLGSRVKVRLYSSHNNFETPLENLTGDIGFVMPGPNRRITWYAGDLIQMADSITFEFKGEIVYGLKFINPAPNQNLKRGRTHTIQWEGGIISDTLTLSLLTPDDELKVLYQTCTKNSFEWTIPDDFKIGSGYTLRMLNSGNVIEHRFAIKRKIPIGWYAAPVVGILVGIIAAGGGSDDNGLPDAPSPN